MTDAPSSDDAGRLRRFFSIVAVAAAGLTFVVIVASAFMRHSQAGLNCSAWPACYGSNPTATTDIVPSMPVRLARIAHRLAATGVLALIFGMLLIAWTQKPAWRREGALALAALALAAGLAVLGIATPGARMPAVTLGNLLGGYLMFAILCAIVAITGSTARPIPDHRLAGGALALVLAQAALGALIGAQYALTACPTLLTCPAMPGGGFVLTEVLNPFRPLSVVDGRALMPPGAADLHVIHRALAVAVTFVALSLAYRIRRTDRRVALMVTALAASIPILGAATIAAMPSLALTVLHNAAAALIVGALAAVAAPNPVAVPTSIQS